MIWLRRREADTANWKTLIFWKFESLELQANDGHRNKKKIGNRWLSFHEPSIRLSLFLNRGMELLAIFVA